MKYLKCSYPYEILVVDNGSTDGTIEWLKTQKVTLIENGQNFGVPYASNTMYDYTWKDDTSNVLVVISNDNILLPTAIDNLVEASKVSKASVVSGDTISSPVYLAKYHEDRKFFSGGNKISLDSNKWSSGKHYNLIEETADDFVSSMYGNLVPVLANSDLGENWGYFVPAHRLYKKDYFDTIGYWDANFYPLYSSDFDYTMRAKLLNKQCDVCFASLSFEFWSRCLYEGAVPIVDVRRDDYYKEKWGDGWSIPFNGKFPEKYAGYDTSKVKIDSRIGELDRVKQLMVSNLKGTCIPGIGLTIQSTEEIKFPKTTELMGTTIMENNK